MKLRIVTPLDIAVDEDGATGVRAEDATGAFGILSGHAEFLTRLVITVVRWTALDGRRRYCAVRGGVLSIDGGDVVSIATREAVVGDDLASLEQTVLARFRDDMESDRAAHLVDTRLQLNAIRRIVERLQPRRTGSLG